MAGLASGNLFSYLPMYLPVAFPTKPQMRLDFLVKTAQGMKRDGGGKVVFGMECHVPVESAKDRVRKRGACIR